MKVLLFLLLLCSSVAHGQTWLTWNTGSGFPSNQVTDMAITEGFTAVSTTEGIAIYVYEHAQWYDTGDYSDKLQGLSVRAIDFDENKTLWAATGRGLYGININGFPSSKIEVRRYGSRQGLQTKDIEAVQVHDNEVYAGTFGGWIFRGSLQSDSTISFFQPVKSGSQPQKLPIHSISSVGVSALAVDYPNGGLYSTRGNGLRSILFDIKYKDGWIDDFLSFVNKESTNLITVAQDTLGLFIDNAFHREFQLPEQESWITSVAVVPSASVATRATRNRRARDTTIDYSFLDMFLGENELYVGTKGGGLWIYRDKRWLHYTEYNSPLPSNNINKLYFIAVADSVAILSDGGLTLISASPFRTYDLFANVGTGPSWAKTMWPFMKTWGPYIYGWPCKFYYPIAEYIGYGKMYRSKDLWLMHEKGLSRFVYPAAFLPGVMQFRYRLASRHNTTADPFDERDRTRSSVRWAGNPPIQYGEATWHHYSLHMPQEQPCDGFEDHLSCVRTSRDGSKAIGPTDLDLLDCLNTYYEQMIEAQADESIEKPQLSLIYNSTRCMACNRSILNNMPDDLTLTETSQILSYFEKINNNPDAPLYSILDLHTPNFFHGIPGNQVNDFAIDYSERAWVVMDNRMLAVLNEPEGSEVTIDSCSYWFVLDVNAQPWFQGERIIGVFFAGGQIFVSTDASGVYYIDFAKTRNPELIRSSDWNRIEPSDDVAYRHSPTSAIEILEWDTINGPLIVFLQKNHVAFFDGYYVDFFPVSERDYNCMVVDRDNILWIGSNQGLSYITPDFEINERVEGFAPDRVTSIAAAPLNANYPHKIAVATDRRSRTGGSSNIFRGSDPMPYINPGNMFNLDRIESTYVMRHASGRAESFVYMYDGNRWEKLTRPGVQYMLFDDSYLWLATSRRLLKINLQFYLSY